jgi:putative NADH-flavin reductase
MKIGIIGASGKAGRLIAAEANLRGHEVTAIVRDKSKIGENDYRVIEKSIFNISPDDLDGLDVVVDAFGTAFDEKSAESHVDSLEYLISVVKKVPNLRILVVGGAGSLFASEDKKRLVIEEIPAEWRSVPRKMAAAFDLLKKSGINWTYFSPAVEFDPAGARMGKYVLGGDVAVKNSTGESYLTYADYAIALVDEIENKKYFQARFTAACDKPAIVFPPTKPIPYYGIFKAAPVFEGMSQYRPPFNFELSGRQYRLVFDDDSREIVRFVSEDILIWGEAEKIGKEEYYECVKIDALTYFINFEIAGLKPRTNITLVLDLEQGLVSRVTSWTRFDSKYPTLCDNKVVFGAIAVPGIPLSENRHSFTGDLIGKRIHWHYSPQLEIIHVYYNPQYASVTFPEGKSWEGIPPDLWNKYLELNPYDEPAWYVKIKKNIYFVSVIEHNMAKRGMCGNSLLFLIDTRRIHDVGRSFGYTGRLPEVKPENYIFGAYGNFVYSDGVIEAKQNKNKRLTSE